MRWCSLVALLTVLAGPGIAVAHSPGWAVGESGTILHSPTGGAYWVPQTSGSSADLRGVAFSPRFRGIAVGDDGAILYTVDGGENWSAAESGSTADLHAVAFSANNTAWAVGRWGTILYTYLGGAYWHAETSGTTQILYGVDFIDRNTGWAVGANGTILHTSNGMTWSPQASGSSAVLRDVDFIDADIGWAVGSNGTILRTLDGGATWSPQASGTVHGLRAVEFIDADNGLAVGDENTILRTLDGGATWISAWEPGYPPYSHLRGVAFASTNRGTAVGIGYTAQSEGVALHTWTSGANWEPRMVSESAQLNSVAFFAHSEHWVGGDLCRSQCLVDISPCEKRPRSEFPDYPEAVQELIAWASQFNCNDSFPIAIEGTCGDGQVLFTKESDGMHTFTYFHDSATLRFTGLTTGSDVTIPPCGSAGYWPDPIACPDATVTAVHCGTAYSLGDPVYMPPDGTLPIEGAFVYPEDVPALPSAAGIYVIAGLLLTAAAWLRRSARSPGTEG